MLNCEHFWTGSLPEQNARSFTHYFSKKGGEHGQIINDLPDAITVRFLNDLTREY